MELNMKRTNITTAASMRNIIYQVYCLWSICWEEEPHGNDI